MFASNSFGSAPQEPVRAVTTYDSAGNLVPDPSTDIMIENFQLKRENQALINSIYSKLGQNIFTETLRFDIVGFSSDSFGVPILFKKNCYGQNIAYAISLCHRFSVIIDIEVPTEKITFKVSFFLPNEQEASFSISEDDFCPKSLLRKFNSAGGVITYTTNKSTAEYVFSNYIATLVSEATISFSTSRCWCRSECGYLVNRRLNYRDTTFVNLESLDSTEEVLYWIINTYALLNQRLPEKIRIGRCFCFITPSTDECLTSLELSPKRFQHALDDKDFGLNYVYLSSASNESGYYLQSKTKENLAYVDTYINTGSHNAIPVVLSKEVLPVCRDMLLVPLKGIPSSCSIYTFTRLREIILSNAQAFDKELNEAFYSKFNEVPSDSSVRTEVATLYAVASVMRWGMQIIGNAEDSTRFWHAADKSINEYAEKWDNMDSTDIFSLVKESFSYLISNEMIPVYDLDLGVAEGTKLNDICLVDNDFAYITLEKFTSLLKENLPEFLPMAIIESLRKAGKIMDHDGKLTAKRTVPIIGKNKRQQRYLYIKKEVFGMDSNNMKINNMEDINYEY